MSSRKNRSCLWIFAVSATVLGCSGEPPITSAAEPTETVAQAASAVVVSHSNWSGASAHAYMSGDLSSGYVQAWEEKTSKSRKAYVSFGRNVFDPESAVCDYGYCRYTRWTWQSGWGEIPSAAFEVGANSKTARLSLDLTANPQIQTYGCTYDSSTSSYSNCGPFSGSLDISWSDEGTYASSFTGVSSTRWGSYTTRSTGQYDSVRAVASGQVLGDEVSATGSLSQSKGAGVTMDIVKN